MTVTDDHARLIDDYGRLATDHGELMRKFTQVTEQLEYIRLRERMPLICKLLGHRWKITHVLKRDPYGHSVNDMWVYYAHTCTRCWYEEKRSFWPSL